MVTFGYLVWDVGSACIADVRYEGDLKVVSYFLDGENLRIAESVAHRKIDDGDVASTAWCWW